MLLRLTPRGFRERYGDELLRVHDARGADVKASLPRRAFAVREVAGMARTVVALRMGEGHTTTTTRGGASMFDNVWQDVRFSIRTLRRNPGYTTAAVAVLALGIGSTTAIFSAANAYLFRPLPFAEPDRLVTLFETNPEFGWEDANAAPANVLDWQEQVAAFDGVASYSTFSNKVPFVREGEPELLSVINVTGNFFSVLGVAPEVGRGFVWDETWQGNDNVVVLSHGFWVSHFGADPSVVGTTLDLGSATVEIVGVAPAGFSFPTPGTDMWSPWGWDPEARTQVWFRRAHWVTPVARLAPGVTPEQADAEFQTVVKRLQVDFPETNRVMGARFMPIRDFLIRDVRLILFVLSGAVSMLLLLACTNVANLNLVRASGRTREVALRFALGAGRRRIVRQLLTEGLVVAAAGGILGLGLGWLGIRALSAKQTLGIEGATSLVLDARVVLATLAATLVAGLLSGAAPAFRGAGADVQASLKDGGRGASLGRGGIRLVNSLVVVEVALAVLLVVGAGLTARSFWLLRSVDPGFETSGVLALQFTIPSARYSSREEVLAFQDDFERRLEGRPGIQRAGLVGQLPLNGSSWSSQFQAEGWPPDRVGFEILHRRADSGYFEALGIPLLRGRLFEPTDAPDGPNVVVINETFAKEHFPDEDPIGKRIAYDRAATPESIWYEVVGIVGDQAQVSPGQPPRAEVFEFRDQDWGRTVWFVVRTEGETAGALAAARSVLREIDPLIPLAQARPLREVWRRSMASDEFILTLLGAFGALALILATVGVYGVTAQAAKRRTQEIGIRMALGAAEAQVVGMMLLQGMALVGLGLLLGLGVAVVASGVLETLLFGVAPNDPATLAAVVTLLAAVAAAACYLPARRATAVDPVESLRSE
jgi:predicted permease